MKKNLFILGLVCVIVVLVATIWCKEDLKKDSMTISSPVKTTDAAVSKIEKTKALVALESEEVDQKLEKLGFASSANVHKITITQ
jgi:hypothetical protein